MWFFHWGFGLGLLLLGLRPGLTPWFGPFLIFFREAFRAAAWSARALAPTQKASAMPASPKYISNVDFLGRCG